MPTTRLSLMLPGAVSLGAYEGGALAALLTAVQRARGDLVVDSIASASAGSITGLIASRALLSGADPIALMTATWVDLPDLDRLKTHDVASPLSMDRLAEAAVDILGTKSIPDGPPGCYLQDSDVHLSMAVTALGGLTYELAALRPTATGRAVQMVSATTYLDFITTSLAARGSGSEPDYLGHVDAALASGSTPVGFPPKLLDRRADSAKFREAGLAHPDKDSEDDWWVWYSDGGDVDNEPFGRLLDLIGEVETAEPAAAADGRVIVMLDTEPSTSKWAGKWFDRDEDPTWTSTLLRVNKVRTAQSNYEDLRRLEKTNSRLMWVEHVGDEIEAALADLRAELPEADRGKVDDARARMLAAADQVAADKALLRAATKPETPPAVPSKGAGAADPANVAGAADPTAAGPRPGSVTDLIKAASGLSGKEQVLVEIISPDIDPNDHRPAQEKLAGEFLFHFGGFFDVAIRQSDFELGYRNATTWLEAWLGGRVRDAAGVMKAVHDGYDSLPWGHVDRGDASLGSLSFREKLEGIGLFVHVGHVIEHGLRADVKDPGER